MKPGTKFTFVSIVMSLVIGCAQPPEDQEMAAPPAGQAGNVRELDSPLETMPISDPVYEPLYEPKYKAKQAEKHAAKRAEKPLPPYVIKTVFYATDRKPVRSIEEWREARKREESDLEYYGKDWAGKLELGWCNVSIPTRDHEIGIVERPRFYQAESVEKHFVILTLEPGLSKDSYYARVKSEIEQSSQDDALVFIHGFNVKFADAIMRTAQIAYDVGFEGAPILYSWPSAGALENYPRDVELVNFTVDHLKMFLEDLRQRTAPKKLHLVAHSMGNRALTQVLRHFVRTEGGPVFNEIVLAAPDVNRERFVSQILPGIRGAGKRLTLYASSDDLPLRVSRRFNDQPRAGEGLPHLIVADGMDTIDATGIDTDMLGHSYFSQARPIVDDLAAVICQNHGTDKRSLLEASLNGLKYWKVKR